MLLIALMTVLAVGETCTDMAQYGWIKESFLRRFMTLKHGTPNHDVLSDLFNCLDPDELGRTLAGLSIRWAEAMKPYLGDYSEDVIAIDGKALRLSFAGAYNCQPLHLVHAFAAGSK